MNQVRFGIIGVGVQGSYYAGFLTGNSQIAAVKQPEQALLGALCDIDPAKLAACREKYPDIPVFTDYRALIDSGLVDAVITTVPHYLHPEIAIYALGHGVHALVEKPAGVYAKQVREMNEFAAAHPELTFGIMFNQRTNLLYQKIREIIRSGELGKIRRSNWIINTWWRSDSYYRQSAWRATWGAEGGGVLVNQAPHQLDLWQWICGVPVKVWAKVQFGSHRDIVVENDVTAVVDYGNGATGVLVTCTHDILGTDRLEINLDRGKIIVEQSDKATIYRFKKSEDEINAGAGSAEIDALISGRGS
ncbi:MAG TPA: gfo/Idh/MocA family oxidoreductase, partial [Clostridiales bacterium]|nr:gfo/Idh/MocA family oxidoreductase [Clostridiales bacterium]